MIRLNWRRAIDVAIAVITMGCGYHHPTNPKPNSGMNRSECVGDSGVTGHVLRDRCHDEAIQIINEASGRHRLRG